MKIQNLFFLPRTKGGKDHSLRAVEGSDGSAAGGGNREKDSGSLFRCVSDRRYPILSSRMAMIKSRYQGVCHRMVARKRLERVAVVAKAPEGTRGSRGGYHNRTAGPYK